MDLPKVSIVICTLNCVDYTKRCLQSIRKQDYPQDKVEIIVVDSYSTDGTIEAAENLGARVILTKIRGYMEGKGMPKSIGCNSATGDIVITIDSDNAMVENDWLRKMVKPLLSDPDVNICICRQWVSETDPLINQYVSLIGTDPFASYCSIDSQLALKRLPLIDKGEYYTYTIQADNFYILGGYYLTFRRKTLEEMGGYTRDVDVIHTLADQGKATVAIVKGVHLHHLITKSTPDFFRKKVRWGSYYFSTHDPNRTHQWAEGLQGKARFVYQVLKRLVFIPALIESFYLAIRDRQKAWLLHAPISWLTTYAYIYAWFKVQFKKLAA